MYFAELPTTRLPTSSGSHYPLAGYHTPSKGHLSKGPPETYNALFCRLFTENPPSFQSNRRCCTKYVPKYFGAIKYVKSHCSAIRCNFCVQCICRRMQCNAVRRQVWELLRSFVQTSFPTQWPHPATSVTICSSEKTR